MSRIEQLISDIESYIDTCKYYPLSNVKIIVNKETLEDMLTELRLKTPDEVKKYQKILSNKDAILADAKEQADAIINAAQVQTEELINEHEIMQRAYAQANDLIEQMESGHFAYADMLEHVENLYERMMAHDAYLEEFEKQKDEIEKKNQEAEELIENINIVLLEIKSEIKNEHLPLVNDSYRDYIADSYNKVEEIKRFKAHKPVVLNELCAKVEGARDVIYKLYDNVHNMIVTAGMVEDAIVYANRYRSMFLEVNTELTKAEVLFRNGEYRNALQVAVDILERLEPGKYEELIKRKEIKSA